MSPTTADAAARRARLRAVHVCTLVAVALFLGLALLAALPAQAAGDPAPPADRARQAAVAASIAAAIALTIEAESGVISGAVVLGADEAGAGYVEFGAPLPAPGGSAPLTVTPPITDNPPNTGTPQAGFSFGAAGDHGSGSKALTTLDALARSATDFYLALGDFNYTSSVSEAEWCALVQSSVGMTYPFQLLVGNHEDEPSDSDGFIDDYVACLPDRLGVYDLYAHRYSFDYPPAAPLARFILIDPDLDRDGAQVQFCTAGETENCAWLQARIDEAQALGLWTIVGYHKNCHTIGEKPCEVGEELVDMLVQRKVDLILMGHDHGYQRSKQVAMGPACATLPAGGFDPDCVADDGSDGVFARGQGAVWVLNAAAGVSSNRMNLDDPEIGYLATWMDRDTASTGFSRFTVTPTRLDAQFVTTRGSYTDAFAIVGEDDPGCPVALPAGQGVVTLEVNAPVPGSYRIWSRQWISATAGADLWVQVDGGCPERLAPAQAAPGAWQWVNTLEGDPARPFAHQLLAGAHTIRLSGGAGLRIDRLLLTTDATCNPAEGCATVSGPLLADVFLPVVTQ